MLKSMIQDALYKPASCAIGQPPSRQANVVDISVPFQKGKGYDRCVLHAQTMRRVRRLTSAHFAGKLHVWSPQSGYCEHLFRQRLLLVNPLSQFPCDPRHLGHHVNALMSTFKPLNVRIKHLHSQVSSEFAQVRLFPYLYFHYVSL